jgi:hypothetical protein
MGDAHTVTVDVFLMMCSFGACPQPCGFDHLTRDGDIARLQTRAAAFAMCRIKSRSGKLHSQVVYIRAPRSQAAWWLAINENT